MPKENILEKNTKNYINNSFYEDVLKELIQIENLTYREKVEPFCNKLSELARTRNMDIECDDGINGGLIINLDYTNQTNGDYYRSCFGISRIEFNKYYAKYSIDDFVNRYFNTLVKNLKKVN